MNSLYQPDFNHKPKRAKLTGLFLSIILLVGSFLTFSLAKSWATRDVVEGDQPTGHFWKRVANVLPLSQDNEEIKKYVMPVQERNRLDILILGMRGEEDIEDGGLLSDTILLFSFDKITKKSSLVSMPRDLYVRISPNKKDKINSAYERLGASGAKKLVSKITGVYVDNIVVFDFSSFEKIITDLGGIDITLDKPFEETTQWGYKFSLPAGKNHLDGQNALYYVRSRFSSSDFDRAARQQKVIFAIKDKVFNSDFFKDPIKAFGFVNTIRSNIQTDISVLDMKDFLNLAQEVDGSSIKKGVITTDNLVYESRASNMYILLPKGDNFDLIKKFFQEIL